MSTPSSDAPSGFPWVKAVITLFLGAAIIGLGVVGSSWLAAMKQQPPQRDRPEKVYSIEAFEVESADLQEIITAFGTTRPNREVTIEAQVAGEIVKVHNYRPEASPKQAAEQGLKVGQHVRGPDPIDVAATESLDPAAPQRYTGDLLLQIDGATYQERIAQATNRINEGKAELQRLLQEQTNNERLLEKVNSDYKIYKQQYDRVARLNERKIATDSELSNAKLELAKYEDAQLQRKNEQALFPTRIELQKKKLLTFETDLKLAQIDLKRTNVRPPFSGMVSEVMVDLGTYVHVGEPMLRLTDTSEIEIPLPLTLYDYAKIERKLLAGEKPRVELSENETTPKRWVGHVVRRAPEADVTTRTVNVYVHVDNHGLENSEQPIDLLPSVFVHARIAGPIIKQVIVVPRDVIRDGKLFVITQVKPVIDSSKKNDPSKDIQLSMRGGQEYAALEGIAAERPVTVLRTLRNLAIISDGLKPGDHIAMTNLDVIHTGAKVRVESKFTLNDALDEQGTPALRRYVPAGELAGGPSVDDRDKQGPPNE